MDVSGQSSHFGPAVNDMAEIGSPIYPANNLSTKTQM